jgi:hypothetical protein
VSGLFFVGAYVVGVVEILVDQPADRSWLFWGLGIASIGGVLLVSGVALIFVWRKIRPGRGPG